ncbi:F-box domain-containing protein [Mycena indigotica]|uniref:F-box domain-containing protein n=1 Tax=Mycena indigotica TaxID=2126181 RepID=A0A8H6ST52_9AGAR|nr:F-box domain-containing protein [Mycena indigotica]KAF7303897.1 F-box domain-containing protein [Mycena indigotica]
MYRHISAPILALPVELLSHIFVLATHDTETVDDDCPSFNSTSVLAPLDYGLVCKLWRYIALNTPALYTSICITPELLHESDSLDLRGIATYLKLSRNYPLDILIDARDQDWDFDDEGLYMPWFTSQHMAETVELILPFIHRWRSLSIFTDISSPMHTALRMIEGRLDTTTFSSLESLRLMRCDAYAAYGEPNSSYSFLETLSMNRPSILPCLRQLTLRGVSAAWTPLSAHLTASLSAVELAFLPNSLQPSLSELSGMLCATSNLERLTLNVAGPVETETDDLPTLPKLASLYLGYTSIGAGAATLRFISAAATSLNSISLEDASDPASLIPLDAAPMLSLLFSSSESQRPFPNLAKVALRRVMTAAVHVPDDVLVLDHLELVNVSETLFDLGRAARHICVRGRFIGPFTDSITQSPTDDWLEHVTLSLISTKTPRLIEAYEEVYSDPLQQSVQEWVTGDIQVRVVRMHDPETSDSSASDEDDDETMSLGSDEEDWSPFGGSQPRSNPLVAMVPSWAGILGGGNVVVRLGL